MALEMRVYREVSAYEARVMFGLSWRQLAALAAGVPLAAGCFSAIAWALHHTGATWAEATDVAMWVIFPILIPVAAWGWWRPKGLKPEKFVGYLLRHYLTTRKVIIYDDTYRVEYRAAAQPVPGSDTPADEESNVRRAVPRARWRRKVVPCEHFRSARQE